MDFGLKRTEGDCVTSRSGIKLLDVPEDEKDNGTKKSLTRHLVEGANRAARATFCHPDDDRLVDGALYKERLLERRSDLIQEGDLVVIFESFDNLSFVYAKKNKVFSNRNGQFPHNYFINKLPFGSKLRSQNNQGYGFVYLLKPTPELWARSLPHRTQIVHELDASMICFYLDLRPNMVVCESGTGSGALSHCILRNIAPHGHLHTYEFHQERADKARAEFVHNKVDHMVTVHHRDVCGKDGLGGGFAGRKEVKAHAISLDLPEPWLAIPHVAVAIRPCGRLASYSPCMEQVQRTIVAMKEHGFHSIKTFEFRLREHYVDQVELEAPPSDRRPRHVPSIYTRNPDGSMAGRLPAPEDYGKPASSNPSKKRKTGEEDDEGTEHKSKDNTSPVVGNDGTNETTTVQEPINQMEQQQPKKKKTVICARPFPHMRGHTAFLTFATASPTPLTKPEETQIAEPTPTDDTGR